jgi:hypothetical protein
MATTVSDIQASLDRAVLGPPNPRPITRLRVLLHRSALDRALAEGTPPESSAELSLRASRLVSRHSRTMLAGAISRILAEAKPDRAGRWSSAVPLNRSEISAARPLLVRIGAVLELEGPVYCQGAAMLTLLLSDGASPFYGQSVAGVLTNELERVIAALEGR